MGVSAGPDIHLRPEILPLIIPRRHSSALSPGLTPNWPLGVKMKTQRIREID
jgi:hypothetical protein